MTDGTKGCFKIGCVGCLTIIGLCVGLVFFFGAIQLTTDWEPNPERKEATQILPPAPTLPELTEFPGQERPATELAPLPADFDTEPPDAPGGRLVLDLRVGEFIIEPGPADQPIRVEADYDSSAFNLEESFTERDDGTWVYKVTSKMRGGWFGMLMRGGVRDGDHRLRIIIPRDHPIEIVGKIGMGESEIDLGGLWVRAVDLEMSAGDHFLEFSEPLRFPMGSFAVNSSMGAVELRRLGNASPSSVDVEHSMGEIFVDLEGPWRNDAKVTVGFGMGECKLRLPENTRIDVSRARVSMGERSLDLPSNDDLPADAPTLTLDLKGSMGELSVKQ